MSARFHDPDGKRYGVPTFPYRLAPDGYATKRQLRRLGLRPGAQPVCGQLMWHSRKARRRGGVRAAYLYDITKAKPVREMTPARWQAHEAMMRARRTCPECGIDRGYVIPTSLGCCVDCTPAAAAA